MSLLGAVGGRRPFGGNTGLAQDLCFAYDMHDDAANKKILEARDLGSGTLVNISGSNDTEDIHGNDATLGDYLEYLTNADYNDMSDLSDMITLDGTKPFTLSFLLYFTKIGSSNRYIGSNYGVGAPGGLRFLNYQPSSSNSFWFELDDESGLYSRKYQSIATAGWHHCVATYDDDGGTKKGYWGMKNYVDATEGGTNAGTASALTYPLLQRDFWLMDSPMGLYANYNGYLGHFFGWQRALSQDDVTALYNGGAVLQCF